MQKDHGKLSLLNSELLLLASLLSLKTSYPVSVLPGAKSKDLLLHCHHSLASSLSGMGIIKTCWAPLGSWLISGSPFKDPPLSAKLSVLLSWKSTKNVESAQFLWATKILNIYKGTLVLGQLKFIHWRYVFVYTSIFKEWSHVWVSFCNVFKENVWAM